MKHIIKYKFAIIGVLLALSLAFHIPARPDYKYERNGFTYSFYADECVLIEEGYFTLDDGREIDFTRTYECRYVDTNYNGD